MSHGNRMTEVSKWKIFAIAAMVLVLGGCPSGKPVGGIVADLVDVLPDGSLPDGEDVVDVIVPAGCNSNLDCPEGVCNLTSHTCVECMVDSHCPTAHICQKFKCVKQTMCAGDKDCPEGSVCDPSSGICVDCLTSKDCPEGYLCQGKQCLPECGTECPEGTVCFEALGVCVECMSDSDCDPSQWCDVTGMVCVDDLCPPWVSICLGGVPAVCAENGQGWELQKECPAGSACVGGKCVQGKVCTPGERTCKDDSTVLVCNQDGTKLTQESCPSGQACYDGKCIEGCVPNCPVNSCGPSNCQGIDCGPCPLGSFCGSDGFCHEKTICTPGEKKCQGNGVIVCLPDGSGWSGVKPCAPGTECKNGSCKEIPTDCVPGQTKCVNGLLSQCGPDGYWIDPLPCPNGGMCVDGMCIGVNPQSCATIISCMMNVYCEGPDPDCLYACVDASGSDPEGIDLAWKLIYCVTDMCGMWMPQSECFSKAMKGQCYDVYQACMGSCIPNCAGKQCGPDGCGGSCGFCPEGVPCNSQGQCLTTCKPKCAGKDCGPDGCGGSCGSCPVATSCNSAGICVQTCIPNCKDKECGSDGCGGVCGLCSPSYGCKGGICVPATSCKELMECNWSCAPGDEKCGNECWSEASSDAKLQWLELVYCIQEVCGQNAGDWCAGQAIQGKCKKFFDACMGCTPACMGKQCGPDGCGGTCGTCPVGFECDLYGYCLCKPQCTNKQCGNDSCGGSCGTCPTGSVCNYLGKCVCMPQCEGKQCGPDGCGGSCGSCPPGSTCSPQGLCQGQKNCGNGWCQPGQGENCSTCPQDCGPCAQCGDKICSSDESCLTCPLDCGPCSGDCCTAKSTPGCDNPEIMKCVCGMDPYCCQYAWDAICVSEVEQCGMVCSQPPKECGNGWCQPELGETCTNCPQDCGPCGMCGDGVCSGSETCMECPWDCGKCYGDCCKVHDNPGCEVEEISWCVCSMDPFCCQGSWMDWCVSMAIEMCGMPCKEPCKPQCFFDDGTIKQCGPDGCGGLCGTCPAGQSCSNGKCIGGQKCADLVQCALSCGFSLSCYYECYNKGTPEAKEAFQSLSMCVAQTCGFQSTPECILQSFNSKCATQYKTCLAN